MTALRAVGREAPGADSVVVGLSPAGRRRRFGLAGVGLLFVVVAALGAVWFVESLRQSTPVLVLASDLEAGQVLGPGDLVVAELGTDGLGQVDFVDAGRQDEVVGLSALGPIPSGVVVSHQMFGEREAVVPEGHTVVGVVLAPGALPAGVVEPGDTVELIAVAPPSQVLADGGSGPGPVVLGRAVVWAVDPPLEFESGTSLSVVVESSLAGDVAQAAADGRLRLGLVGS